MTGGFARPVDLCVTRMARGKGSSVPLEFEGMSRKTSHRERKMEGEVLAKRFVMGWAVLFLLIYMLSGCSSNPKLVVAAEDWVFEERAISIEIDAPADLNALNGRPHTLVIGVYQLNDPNTFSGLATTREGAVELLSKGKIDDTIAHFRRITVQPGESRAILLSRAQSAQYVGLIMGYYGLQPGNDVHLFPIPAKPSKRGLVEKGLVMLGLISDEAKATPDRLMLRAELGRTGTKRVTQLDPKGI